jgi:signal transduction histidine kinase
VTDTTDLKLVRRFEKFSLVLAILAVLVGLSVYLGYILEANVATLSAITGVSDGVFHILTHALKAVFPQLPVAMNPATAAAFIASGLSLLVLLRGKNNRPARIFGILCAVLVLLIGGVKLIGIFTGHDVFFDRFLFHAQLNAEGLITGRPNQIAPNTAFNFFLMGVSLLLLYAKKFKFAQGVASVTFFIALLAVLGYIYGVAKLIGIAAFIPMALNTALAFMAVSLSLLFAFPECGYMAIAASSSAGGIITRRLIPTAIIVPGILGYVQVVAGRTGYIPIELGLSLLVVGNIVLFVVVIWRESIVLHHVDEQRKIADAKLVEFISLASHQLKSPPGGIKWNTELLLDPSFSTLTPEQRGLVETIRESASKMVETVNSLLNVSRLDLGTFIVDPKPVDFHELAQGALGDLKPDIQLKHLVITENYDAQIPPIPFDPGLAKIIVENLISNAVKYTPPGGTVGISITCVQNGSHVLIRITDTGYGIPLAQQGRIFEKMFRADNVQEKMDGTGFGLYLLKSVVELAEGKVCFDSVENKGSTFYVELPVTGMRAHQGTSHLTNVS